MSLLRGIQNDCVFFNWVNSNALVSFLCVERTNKNRVVVSADMSLANYSNVVRVCVSSRKIA